MAKENPADRRYTREHEWAQDHGDGTITMGITDYAQEMLTDIVYVELPALGKKVKQAETIAVVESVKSVSDIYSPVSGEVIEVNQALENNPELINQDAFGQGWIVKIRMDDAKELEMFLDAAGYDVFLKEVKH